MPKVVPSHRRPRVQQTQSDGHYSETSSISLNAPRKVSFEDGHQSSCSLPNTSGHSSSACSSSSSIATAGSLFGSRSSLRRKPPSVCLVDLAEEGSSTPVPNSREEEAQHCISPSAVDGMEEDKKDKSSPCPSSPWGHFVDILIPLDEEREDQHHPHRDMNKKRALEDDGSFHSGFFASIAGDWDQSRPNLQRQKSQRRSLIKTSPSSLDHPYGVLPPRRQQRLQNGHHQEASGTTLRESFLPGFFLGAPTDSLPQKSDKSPETNEVEVALKRLKVG